MDIFNDEDYYPVPSDKVISFGESGGSTSGKIVLKADLVALIIHLSSPMGDVDYSALSDLFLVYRNFMSSMELSDLLIMRFRWCAKEVTSSGAERAKIGRIALVRTFVLLRHWILNYFIQDFLSHVELRLRIIKFLNEPCTASPTVTKSTIINMKKAWVQCMENTWTNIDLEEPAMIGNDDEWVEYQICDYSQLEDVRKRDSQLSSYAKHGASSPSFRNQSVLSLFKNTELFKFVESYAQPKSKSINKHRTGSMMLFPRDNSNAKNEIERLPSSEAEKVNSGSVEFKSLGNHISKITNVSHAIKDLKCPESPGVDKLMPPTPARKVELILKLPENIETMPETSENFSSQNIVKKSTDKKQPRHRGAVGLLSKWRRNHSSFGLNQSQPKAERIKNGYSKPEMDNFVKYVISITSLENREQENIELMNLVHSKFDILSARTIEEVEYLVSMEKELIKEVQDTVPYHQVPVSQTGGKTDTVSPLDGFQVGFSAVDNLNLYQTVSSIANSVVSLSKTLDQHRKQQPPSGALSPSYAALERRKVQSLITTAMHSHSRFSLVSQYNYKDDVLRQETDGPQRLIFHDNNGCKKFSQTSTSEPVLSVTPSKRAPLQPSNKASPLKQVLPNVYELNTNGNDQRDSFISSISYDSELSKFSEKEFNAHSSQIDSSDENDFPIKRKLAQSNLREFTFEDRKEADRDRNCWSMATNSSFVTTREFEHENTVSTPRMKTRSKALASGRISLIQNKNSRLSRLPSASKSPVEIMKRDSDYIEKDNELLKNELEILELEKKISLRISCAASVNTDILFNSKQNSPRKHNDQQAPHIGLSKKPSMKSVDDGASISTEMTDIDSDNNESGQGTGYNNISSKLNPILNQELYEDSSLNFLNANENDLNCDDVVQSGLSNKYLFSPDSDSADMASPAKNVEELKDKFLKKEDTEEVSEQSKKTSSEEKDHVPQENLTSVNNTLPAENGTLVGNVNGKQKVINRENIVDIANLPDDSVHDDPVNVALMKLEGLYEKDTDEDGKKRNASSIASALAKEVDILGISELAVLPTSPADKRRSLLIERRRQTMINIPFTPINDRQVLNNNAFADPKKITELLNGYENRDPRLLVTNSEEHVPFILMYDSLSVAQQMTLIERELLGEIDWNELLNLNLAYSPPHVTSWLQLLMQNETLSGIDLAIARFNLTVDWIISEIALTSDIKLKRNTIQRFIHVAEHCRVFQNYNTLMEIVLALSSTVVQKFADAWRLIEPGDLLTWEGLRHIPSLDRNYCTIRKLLNNINPITGCIPFIVVYLSDLSLNSEKRTWFVDKKVVNYNKFDTNVQIVKNFIQIVQWSKFYEFTVDNELLSKCVYLSALSTEELTYLANKRNLENH